MIIQLNCANVRSSRPGGRSTARRIVLHALMDLAVDIAEPTQQGQQRGTASEKVEKKAAEERGQSQGSRRRALHRRATESAPVYNFLLKYNWLKTAFYYVLNI